jgi:hypothetical protein
LRRKDVIALIGLIIQTVIATATVIGVIVAIIALML